MVFGNDRKQLRQTYFDAWNKANNNQILTALEQQIVDVIAMHPEYHQLLSNRGEQQLDKDFSPEMGETNPFLHMGLHLGIRDQISTNRPNGIRSLFEKLLRKINDPHQAEHLFMETLAESIWQTQKDGTAPDDAKYINNLKRRVKRL